MKPPEDRRSLDDYLERGLSTAFRRMPADLPDAGDRDREIRIADEPIELPSHFGRYPVDGLIGRGGVGVVARIHDPDLGRELAIKVIRPSCAEEPDLVERFLEEARVCSRLQHPGVVPIHEMGRLDDGRPYFTMKIVDGDTLADLLDRRDYPGEGTPRFLEIFEKVCQTMAYVHSRGIVHGDLKPQNIMVGAFGEVQVMDWGFARLDDRPKEADSSSFRVVGTPAYMAPEQARGDVDVVGPRTDVFGLGAVLCEIFTGAPPYLGETKSEVLLRAGRGWLDDAFARLAACDADDVLINLSRSCLASDPAARPADASVVAQVVKEYLTSLEERARMLELRAAEARAKAEQERRARRLTVALVISIALVVLLAGGGYLLRKLDHHARAAETERAVALAMERARQHQDRAVTADVGDLEPWRNALAAAREAEALARTRDADPVTMFGAEKLRQRLEEEADLAMRNVQTFERLEEIRPHLGDDRTPDQLDQDYLSTFQEYGIDVEGEDLEQAAEVIASSAIKSSLVGALDDWAFLRRRLQPANAERWRRIVRLAMTADPHPWRNDLRDALLGSDVARLHDLAESATREETSSESLDLLARSLIDAGDREAAIEVYRQAHDRQPENFWINHNLASQLRYLDDPPLEEVTRLLSMAMAVRPQSTHVLADLGQAHLLMDDLRNAVPMLERALEAQPTYGRALLFLAAAHQRAGRLEQAREVSLEAIGAGELRAWGILGEVLFELDLIDEAIEAYREAVTHLSDQPIYWTNLGTLLFRKGRLEDARSAFELAIDLDPDVPVANLNLAVVYLNYGRYRESLVLLRRAHELGMRAEGEWTHPTSSMILETEKLVVLEDELERIQAGADAPDDVWKRAGVAMLAGIRGQQVLALQLFESALTDSAEAIPRLGHAYLIEAAHLAAQVGAGLGDDAASLDQGERDRWRETALKWYEAELTQTRQVIEAGSISAEDVHDHLERWAGHPALEPYRDGQWPDQLSPEEREEWSALRAELEATLADLLIE